VKTRDNRLVEIPNSLIVDQPVINYSRPDPSYRLQTDIGIGTGMDIPKVVQILRDAVQEVDGVMKDKGVDVLFIDFGDSSNTFRVRWWVTSYTEKRSVSHAVNTAIQEVATKEGIDMPDTTIALDNRLKFSEDDIDKIIKSFQTSPTTKPPASPDEASGKGEED
jgi:MscS family membrane protein